MPTILSVGDDDLTKNFICLALQEAGYEVHEARNGKEALRRFQLFPTDLVITDIVMPGMNGFEIIWKLTGEFPGVTIIAMDEHSERLEYLALARNFGAQRTLRKPFSVDELPRAVRDELRRNT